MLKKAIIEHCSPTLAGLKTANMFSCEVSGMNLCSEIRKLNNIMTKKGLRIVPIRTSCSKTLFYVYRPDRLKMDLANPLSKKILCEKGYCYTDAENCIVQLAKRLSSKENFPHEIGLFLGYPPEDVLCFINNPHEGVKCVGCWKAYNDVEKAEKTFAKYKKCTLIYTAEINKGKPLERLIVNTNKKLSVSVA